MLQHCIRTVLSRLSTREGKHSKFFIVGTHRDLEGSSSESRAEKNSKLIDMLPPSFQDHLIYYRPFSEVIFPVNAKNPVKLDHDVFAKIREQVEDKTHSPPPYKVPVGWFLLEQDITKSAKGGVISKNECLAIATTLHIDQEALTAALEYFDNLNIFLYYPSILPEVVFSSPQVLPDKVTEFVHFSYSLQSDCPPVALKGMWLQFRDKGIITADMFHDKRFSTHYIPDLFEPSDLIKLFQHLLIIASLSKTEYFMPSLLQTISPEEVREQLPPPSTSAAPLLVHFPAGCAQNGVFCALVVYLLSECHWKVACGPKGTPLCVSRSCIYFQLPDTPVCVALVDSFAFLEVHVKAPQTEYHSVCPGIRKAIFSGLKAAADVLKYNNSTPVPVFLCECSSPPHTTIPDRKFCYLMCTKCTEYRPLTKQHSIWLDMKLSSTPVPAVPPKKEPVSSPLTSSMLLKSASPRKETDAPKKEAIHSPSFPPTPQASTDDTLVNEDFLDITEYLIDMEKTDVYNLGLVLGLRQRKLKANVDSKYFLDDVISAWLRKEDQVIKRGEPSWTVLITALKHRRVSQTGIASNIAKDKGLLL